MIRRSISPRSHFPRDFWSSLEYHIHHQSKEFSKLLNDKDSPQLCRLWFGCELVDNIWEYFSPISFQRHVFFLCLFLDAHPTIQHSNTTACSRSQTEFHTHTLTSHFFLFVIFTICSYESQRYIYFFIWPLLQKSLLMYVSNEHGLNCEHDTTH
jgi:hypothetical protein